MSNTKVTTGEVRFSFPHVFQPHANNPGQEEKYSVTILIPKTDTATIDAIQAAMQAAAQEVVDANCQAILNPAEVYAGCYGRVSLNFFPYNTNGNRGVGCGLNNVQKTREGDPLTGRTTAAEDFGPMPQANVQTAAVPQMNTQAAATQQSVNPVTGINPITGAPINGSGVMGL